MPVLETAPPVVGEGFGLGVGFGDGLTVGEGDGVGEGVGEGVGVGDGETCGDGEGLRLGRIFPLEICARATTAKIIMRRGSSLVMGRSLAIYFCNLSIFAATMKSLVERPPTA